MREGGDEACTSPGGDDEVRTGGAHEAEGSEGMECEGRQPRTKEKGLRQEYSAQGREGHVIAKGK